MKHLVVKLRSLLVIEGLLSGRRAGCEVGKMEDKQDQHPNLCSPLPSTHVTLQGMMAASLLPPKSCTTSLLANSNREPHREGDSRNVDARETWVPA